MDVGKCGLIWAVGLQRVEAWEMGSIWQRDYMRESAKTGSSFPMYEPVNSVMPVGSPVAV